MAPQPHRFHTWGGDGGRDGACSQHRLLCCCWRLSCGSRSRDGCRGDDRRRRQDGADLRLGRDLQHEGGQESKVRVRSSCVCRRPPDAQGAQASIHARFLTAVPEDPQKGLECHTWGTSASGAGERAAAGLSASGVRGRPLASALPAEGKPQDGEAGQLSPGPAGLGPLHTALAAGVKLASPGMKSQGWG